MSNMPPTEVGVESGFNLPSDMSLSSAAESEYQSNSIRKPDTCSVYDLMRLIAVLVMNEHSCAAMCIL